MSSVRAAAEALPPPAAVQRRRGWRLLAASAAPRVKSTVAQGTVREGATMIEINGIAHVMLTVSDFERCHPFYKRILEFMGLKPVIDMDGWLYCVGGRTALGIMRCEPEHAGGRFVQF